MKQYIKNRNVDCCHQYTNENLKLHKKNEEDDDDIVYRNLLIIFAIYYMTTCIYTAVSIHNIEKRNQIRAKEIMNIINSNKTHIEKYINHAKNKIKIILKNDIFK